MPGPLHGFSVIDLSQVVSGPLATMLMADQGADVIKVEPLGMGDVTRVPAFAKNDMGAFYLNNNRGKRALALDLQVEAGQQILLDLCREADVFVQNFRPGAVDRLGCSYEAVAAVNPDIIYVSITGFGPTGPYSDRPVLDPVIQGNIGMVSRQLNPNIPFPDLIRNLICDKTTALTVAQAVSSALLARERGAGGQHIEVPMLDAAMYFFWPDGMMDKTLLDEDASPGFLLAQVYNLTETADGQLVYFIVSDKQRASLCRALGHPEWFEDERFSTTAAYSNMENFAAFGELVNAAFREFNTADIIERMVAEDVPVGPILDADEAIADAQVAHNGTLVQWDHPLAGRVQQPVPAARFSKTPASVPESGALAGAHNDEILAELGRSADDIAALRESGVLP